ncbi:MAG: shikimate dehydrogenase, partial [Bdellovibrionota bacterium]
VNRSRTRARVLIKEFSRLFPKSRFYLSIGEIPRADIYVQATSLGGLGFSKESPISKLNGELSGAFAFDVVYRPEWTPFLKDARRLKMKTAGGLDMLIWQALKTWEIWFDRLDNREKQYFELKRKLRRRFK